jgi:O-antigen/teichoic acid export membrane protein
MKVTGDARLGPQLLASLATFIAKSLTSIVLLLPLARILEVREFGAFSALLMAVTVIALIVDYGDQLRLPMVMAAARRAGLRSDLGTPLRCKLKVASSLALVAATMAWYELISLTAFYALCAALFYAITSHFYAVMRGQEAFEREAAAAILTESTVLAIALTAAVSTASPPDIALALLVSRFGQLVYVARTSGVPTHLMNEEHAHCSTWLRAGAPYYLQVVLASALVYGDSIAVEYIIGGEAAALYQGAMRLVIVATFASSVQAVVFLPRIARKSHAEKDAEIRRSILVALVCGAVAAVTTMLAGPQLIRLLLGAKYSGLAEYSTILAAILFFRYLTPAFGTILTATGLQGRRLRAQLMGAILISGGAAVGAAISGLSGGFAAAVSVAAAVSLLYYVDVRRFLVRAQPVEVRE